MRRRNSLEERRERERKKNRRWEKKEEREKLKERKGSVEERRRGVSMSLNRSREFEHSSIHLENEWAWLTATMLVNKEETRGSWLLGKFGHLSIYRNFLKI